ncbi:MAG: hypothetical protein COW12_00300 [Candidatus Omnitrophica bacterium CG12_big_fil_rev_8_21_14_0_65_45_16]|nr:MAG: hypothetical protein COW12_00300 [Candidatus Omnitrophica bacterium CG12_big_fil_rev_8_21_14_0_65_45_16]
MMLLRRKFLLTICLTLACSFQTKADNTGMPSAPAASTANHPAPSPKIQNDDCFLCHDTMHAEKFSRSAHGGHLCTSCHSDIHEIPHEDKLVPVKCGECHRLESDIYTASDHGIALKSGLPAAACLDCHGEPHQILGSRREDSPVNRVNIAETCAKCHEDEKKWHLLICLRKHL